MIAIIVNGKRQQVDVSSDTPLLWVLRKTRHDRTKFGCGIAQCGACTVHLDGQPIRSCITQIGSVKGKKITTIEGLSPDGSHPLQKAWIAEEVPQCGYCQSGRSWRQRPCWREASDPRMPISTPRCREHLPLRNLSAHPARHPPRRGHVPAEGGAK